jgi:tetratricopeptide (TPR) repeat protein
LALQGRFDEAFASSERARRLDPLSLIIATDHAVLLLYARQPDRAIQQFKSVMAMNPHFPRVHMISYAYVEQRRFEDAINDLQSWRRYDQSPWTWALEAYIYGRSQRHQKALRVLPELAKRTRNVNFDPGPMLLLAYIGADDKQRAFELLQDGVNQHRAYVTTLKVDPIYDSLRSDPRFVELLKRVSLSN